MKDNRYIQRVQDLNSALSQLEKSIRKKRYTMLEKDGVRQRYEFCFELCWKCMKDYLESEGYIDIVSPKRVLLKFYELGFISDDILWLSMLDDRNRLAHIYDEDTANRIFDEIKKKYSIELFKIYKVLSN